MKPDNWDPSKPEPHICIYCYGRAPHVFLWKYGIHYVCQDGKCMKNAKRSIGFQGVFVNRGAATERQRELIKEAAKKEAKRGAQRGRGKRGVDDRGSSVRRSDYTR